MKEKFLKYFFILVILISLCKSDNYLSVNYAFTCENYCNYIYQSLLKYSKTTDEERKNFQGQIKFYPLNDITIEIEKKDELEFQISGYFDFQYFKVYTNSINNWKLKSGDSICSRIPLVNNDSNVISLDSTNLTLNTKCILSYTPNFCKNYQKDKTIFLNESMNFRFEDIFTIENQYANFSNLRMIIYYLNYSIFNYFYYNEEYIANLSYIELDKNITFVVKSRPIIQRFKFRLVDPSNYNLTLSECHYSLAIAGYHCDVPTKLGALCETCLPGYYRKSGNSYCTVPEMIEYNYYFSEDKQLYFQCYGRCLRCNKGGNETNQNCTSCSVSYLYYFLMEDNGTVTKNCYSNCSDNYYLAVGDTYQCIDECWKIQGYGQLEDDIIKCHLISEIPNYYIYDNDSKIYKKNTDCHPLCEYCVTKGDDENNQCIKCKEGYMNIGQVCKKICTQSNGEFGMDGNFNCINCAKKNLIRLVDNPFCVSPDQITKPYVIKNSYTNYADYCHSLCNTCSQPPDIKNDLRYCTSCKNGKYLYNKDCITSCNSYSYVNYVNDEGLNVCLNCKTDFTPSKYYYYGKCVDEIPARYYIEGTTTNALGSCYYNCYNCSSYSYCTSCYSYQYLDTYRHSCVSSCSNYYGIYIANKTNKMCINCKKNTIYDKEMYKFETGNNCIEAPDKPFYIKNSIYNIIEYCDEKCSSCFQVVSSTTVKCDACNNGYFLLDGECVESCPDGFIENTTINECTNCKYQNKYRFENATECIATLPKGYYIYNEDYNIIRPCYPTCETCYDYGDENDHKCILCAEGLFLEDVFQKTCIPTCPSGCIYDYVTRECVNCYFRYLYRYDNDTECSVEKPGKDSYIKNRRYNILDHCNGGCDSCFDDSGCTKCQEGYKFKYKSTECVKSCGYIYGITDDGRSLNCTNCTELYKDSPTQFKYYEDDTYCTEMPTEPFYYVDIYTKLVRNCYYRCASCGGEGSDDFHNCTECKSEYDTDGKGNCLACKDIGKVKYVNTKLCIDMPSTAVYYVNEAEGIIADCDTIKCQRCNETSRWCTQCYPGKYLKYKGGDCLTSCGNKLYQDEENRQCINCKDQGLFKAVSNNSCIDEPVGYIMVDTLYNAIELCHDNCQTCSAVPTDSSMNCINCKSGYFLNYGTNDCIPKCDTDKYIEDSNKRECVNCNDLNKYRYVTNTTSCPYDNVPSNNYIRNISHNIIDECGKSCKSCEEGPELDADGVVINDNCKQCNEGNYYSYSENKTNKTCVECGIAYGIPFENEFQMCQKCSERTDSFNYKYNKPNIKCIELPDQNIEPTFIVKDYNGFNVIDNCYELCKTCDKVPEYSPDNSSVVVNMNCLTCGSLYFLSDGGNCGKRCSNLNLGIDSDGNCINCASAGLIRYEDDINCQSAPTDSPFVYVNYYYGIITTSKCAKGTFYDKSIDDCVIECNKTIYVEDQIAHFCINCKDKSKYKFEMDTKCEYEVKPTNSFILIADYNILAECNYACLDCYGYSNDTTTNCIHCANGFYAQFEDNTNCLDYCKDSHLYGENQIDNKCINCKTVNLYKFLNDTKCLNFTVLPKNTYLIYPDYNVFDYCDESCDTCENDKNNCLTCAEGYYFSYEDNTTCVKDCGELYGISDDNTRCEKCTERTDNRNYKFDVGLKCIEKPDTNKFTYYDKYPEYGVISLCYEGCASCIKGPSADMSKHNCIGCKQNYRQSGLKCIIKCLKDTEIYDEVNGFCVDCVSQNKTKVNDSNICIDANDTGYYNISDGLVGKCYKNCESCFDKPSIDESVHNCLTCKNGFYLYKTNCIDECPLYYSENDDLNICENCKDKNMYYFNKSCVENIPSHYYLNRKDEKKFMFNCVDKCSFNCSECNLTDYYCTKCYKDTYLSLNKSTCLERCDFYYGADPIKNECVNCKSIDLYKLLDNDLCQNLTNFDTNDYEMLNEDYNLIRKIIKPNKTITFDYFDTYSCNDGYYLQPIDLSSINTSTSLNDLCKTSCPLNYAKYDLNHTCINCKDINEYKCTNCDYCSGVNVIPNDTKLILIDDSFNIIDGCDGILFCKDQKNVIKDDDNTNINQQQNKTVDDSYYESNNDYYNMTIYTKNTKRNNSSTVNLSLCEDYLKMKNNINQNDDLKYYLVESLVSFDFNIYDLNNNLLDLSVCSDVGGIEIEVPLRNDSMIDNNTMFLIDNILKNKKNQLNDLILYIDLCKKNKKKNLNTNNINNSSVNDKLLNTLNSMCGNENCHLNYINQTSNKINCKCYDNNDDNENLNTNKDTIIYIKKIKFLNLDVLRCFNMIFDSCNYLDNKGYWICLFLIILQIINIVIFCSKGKNVLIKDICTVSSQIKSIPPIKKHQKNDSLNSNFRINNNLISKNLSINSTKKLQDNSVESFKSKSSQMILQKENHNNKKMSKDNELTNKIFYDDYDKAIYEISMSFWDSFTQNLKYKIFIIFSLNIRDPTSFIFAKITSFIICLEANFFFNACLFSDKMKNEINENKDFKFSSKISCVICSSLLTCLVFSCLKFYCNFIPYLKKFISNHQDFKSENLNYINEMVKRITLLNIIFFSVSTFFTIFFWYYIFCFCALYKNITIYWIHLSLESLNFSIIIECLLALIQTTIRRLGIKKENEHCFFVGNILDYL